QPSLQHSRLLYWPSVWMAIFMVGALRFTRNPRVTLAALILLQAAGVTYNIWIYRDMVARCHVIAQGIEYDVRESSSPAQSSRIVLQGVPGTPNGVFYFADEL